MSCLVVDYPVHDFGDLTFKHLEKDEHFMHVPFPRTVGRANKLLSGAVSGAVGAGHTCIMLGGDHRYRVLLHIFPNYLVQTNPKNLIHI